MSRWGWQSFPLLCDMGRLGHLKLPGRLFRFNKSPCCFRNKEPASGIADGLIQSVLDLTSFFRVVRGSKPSIQPHDRRRMGGQVKTNTLSIQLDCTCLRTHSSGLFERVAGIQRARSDSLHRCGIRREITL